MTILHIVPNLPSKADVAIALARGLRETHQLDSVFYSHRPLQDNIYEQHHFDVIPPAIDSLHESIPKGVNSIILHINNASYLALNNKLASQDFVYQLETALDRHSIELITVFHEIPTQKISSFFAINRRHQKLTKQLADLSRSIVTNNRFYERHLIENTSTQIYCVNSFSRVGELQSNNLLGASRCNLVIVGGIERANIYKKKSFLQQTMEHLKLNQIIDIGLPLKSNINTKGLNIRHMGQLLKSEISDQLTMSKVGILDYSRYPGCLGKSSVFNAFKAHGVAPLLLKDTDSKAGDTLTAGTNYYTPKQMDSLKSDRSIAKMAHANYSHYHTHDHAKWVRLMRNLIKD